MFLSLKNRTTPYEIKIQLVLASELIQPDTPIETLEQRLSDVLSDSEPNISSTKNKQSWTKDLCRL